jgi:hypothetical protein
MFAVVLVHPEIPPNTGNVIRLAANTGTALHLVESYRREGGTGGSDDELIDQLAATNLPRELTRAELRTSVRQAFMSVIARLSLFDRELLGDVVLRGRSVDDIARRHDVHRATAVRVEHELARRPEVSGGLGRIRDERFPLPGADLDRIGREGRLEQRFELGTHVVARA